MQRWKKIWEKQMNDMEKKEDSLGIQPCCIDKKLPPLITEGKDCSFFTSQGDWGLEKLWHAVSLLVPSQSIYDENNRIVRCEVFSLLTLPDVNEYTLRFIRNYLDKHWIQALALVVGEEGRYEMVCKELEGLLDRVWFADGRREAVDSNAWIRSTVSQSLVITGPIHHGEGNGRFCQYTSSYSHDPSRAHQAFEPYRRVLRLKASVKGTDPLFDFWVK